MKKTAKILTLILVVVLVLSVFAGCSLVGRNVATYRSAVALTIGGEQITVGKLLDTYNNYYNNYYYYINAGYLDASQLLDMVMSSLIQQYMQISDYVANHEPVTEALASKAHNAEYLTQEQFDYCVKYVNYLAFTAFDQYTDDNISAKYDLNAEETEDTSRDFTEYDDIKKPDGSDYDSYADYTFAQNFINKDANDYFDDYYPAEFDPTAKIDSNAYLYGADSEFAAKRVEEYNDRLTDEEKEAEHKLTVEEYIDIQKETIEQYEETIQNSYGIGLDDFLNNQLADMVNSCILALWSHEAYADIENGMETTLQSNFNLKKQAQLSDFAINDNFDSFITSLSSSSNIFTLPEDADNYVFVKNILIPFTSAQTSLLSAKLSEFGGNDEDQRYIDYRNTYAAQIVAQYFDSAKYTETDEGKTLEDKYFVKEGDKAWFENKNADKKDEDPLWKTLVNPFTTQGGKLVVNPDGVLGQFFNNDGTVKPMEGKSATDTIIELMKRFNTDTAQHTASFDYVVYVGEDWKDYSHSWVKEFYTAVNEDLVEHNGSEVTLKDDYYTLCVSSYGVHIIYLSGKLSDKQYTFDYSKRLDTSDPNYTFFKSYFNTQVSNKTQEVYEQLQLAKFGEGKDYSKYIVLEGGFYKFLKDNEFDFVLSDFISDMIDEL